MRQDNRGHYCRYVRAICPTVNTRHTLEDVCRMGKSDGRKLRQKFNKVISGIALGKPCRPSCEQGHIGFSFMPAMAANRRTCMSNAMSARRSSGLTRSNWSGITDSPDKRLTAFNHWSRNISFTCWRNGMRSSKLDHHPAVAMQVKVTDDALTVDLSDGRTITVPLLWYPRLFHATRAERATSRLIGGGSGIHWPKIDEDISVANLLVGQPSTESPTSLKNWLMARTPKSKHTTRRPKSSSR